MMQVITAVFKPVADIFTAREQRKAAKEAAIAKVTQAKQAGDQQLELNKDEYEQIATSGLGQTWKDEYVTVSVVSILNLVLLGGVATAFGYPQVLQGVGYALAALGSVGVDVGFLLEATVLAGLGLSVWKKI
jgi:hypothetical protein